MILIMIVSIFHLIPSIDLCYFVCSCHCSAFFPTISRCFSCSPSSSDGKKTSGSLSKVMGPQTYIFAFLFQHGGFLSFCQRHGFLAGRVWVFLTFRVFLFVTSWVLEQRFSTPTVEMIPNWRLISCFWSTSKKGCEMLPAAYQSGLVELLALRFEADPLCWQFPGGESWRLSHRGFVLP